MDYYKLISEHAKPVDLKPGASSYGSVPASSYDPILFIGNNLRGNIRDSILGMVLQFLGSKYQSPDTWALVWLAGSGVSQRWEAEREPADLDCLITIDFNLFRMSNVGFVGFSNQEIANQINEELRNNLHPLTHNYLSKYDLTFFVNKEENIARMHPYAAYSLTDDRWIVEPDESAFEQNPEWDQVVDRDYEMTSGILSRYYDSLYNLLQASDAASRRNAEVYVTHALSQGTAYFDMLHENRKQAFSSVGEGYGDFHNYRWQMGKKRGHIQALKRLKDVSESIQNAKNSETYGVELPTTDTLIRRAALQNISNR